MARRQVFGTMMMVACAAALWGRLAAQGSAADAAFATFWSASSPDEAAQLVEPIVRAGVTFDEAFRRLHQGRAYTPRDTGVVRMENRTSDGTEHFFAVNVPDSYDPARRYQVRIQLHGGVGGRATNAPVGNGTVEGQLSSVNHPPTAPVLAANPRPLDLADVTLRWPNFELACASANSASLAVGCIKLSGISSQLESVFRSF
jgi:hypothetical protein